ncbi:hypothetical protein [Streptomyces sp. DH37]|uniref:hypothetical protein n=1 Tax=Streptomyces sp. DH37 TaxID=3040122 RepID=UPI0024426D5D|nr:hypothetical protein [Streptomyces sp. DH37]MDG9701846.1 hypothetical protein [Streptomyces sp. DH37]
MTITPHSAPDGRTASAPPAVDGRPPTGWLDATGRVPAVLAAWDHGALGEVPAGIAWDVVRIPLPLARETVRGLRAARAPLGPVLSTPLGADFVVAPGSADGWEVTGMSVLGRGTLVLLPHPDAVEPHRVGNRGWIVAPTDRALTWGPDLRDAYAGARAAAAARAAAEAAGTAAHPAEAAEAAGTEAAKTPR